MRRGGCLIPHLYCISKLGNSTFLMLKGKGEYIKGGTANQPRGGAIIPTAQRAPGH